MNLSSLFLLTGGVGLFILVSYLVTAQHIEHRRTAAGRFGVIRRRWFAQRITGSRLRWVKTDELKRLIDATPELVVFHLLDDPAEAVSNRLETEIGVTLPQLEEAIRWMPLGARFAVYRVGGIAPELAQRLCGMTHGRQLLLLAGRSSLASERLDGCLAC
jgi:hypothetical protein